MAEPSQDSFSVLRTLAGASGGERVSYFSIPALGEALGVDVARLPYSTRILLENLARHEDGVDVRREDVERLARWQPSSSPQEIAFRPSRVVLQDFTGVPAVVDLAAMRDAMAAMGGDPARINPSLPAELVIDHSVQVDEYGTAEALVRNTSLEFQRNRERYQLLRWGQRSLGDFAVVPPGTGIVHQVNLEYLARVVFEREGLLYPDSVVGTDSHTTMINGLGVLGWGVGGIEAEAAMLGQAISLLVPPVVGFRLSGSLREGATATDLVLTVTEMLRATGVVGKFVEFYGEGLDHLPLADRATLSNMSPEFGSTCAVFPVDDVTVRYLEATGRAERARRTEAYARAQGLFRTSDTPDARYSEIVELDLGAVVPSLAGPRRPQDRVALSDMKAAWTRALADLAPKGERAGVASAQIAGEAVSIRDGSVVIAAITSCTNTSNPSVMVAAGLLARNAVRAGLQVKPWVKTSLAPGSQVVTEYLKRAGLLEDLERLRFHVVGYGCTTCIGNSGPLPPPVAAAVEEGTLVVASVLSGNRNFEGRINPHVRANYLASPPLVVAYALAGRVDVDFDREPLGVGSGGRPVMLADIWPGTAEVETVIANSVTTELFADKYADVFTGGDDWRNLPVAEGALYQWEASSTYVRRPTFLENIPSQPAPVANIAGARVLALLGDSVTTDHISPAGSIAKDSAAAKYLLAHGVSVKDFNSYGSRRGNHEVMVRGTFANVRLRNQLAPGTEGGFTRHVPSGDPMTIFDASERYRAEGVPLVVLAGKEYGTGSSRDWAAKGTRMLGVKAVIAESFERIHRSNLIGMGVLPLELVAGASVKSLGLTGQETYSITGIAEALTPGKTLDVVACGPTGNTVPFAVKTRIDTAKELDYYRHGGILPYVVRRLNR